MITVKLFVPEGINFGLDYVTKILCKENIISLMFLKMSDLSSHFNS